MEPNLIAVVKLPDGDNFLIMDIHGLYFENQFGDVIDGKFSPPSGHQQYKEQFSGIFSYSDTMNYLNFHNHELSDGHTDIISYVMDKFKGFYWKFLGGDQRSKLFDLR